MNIILYLMVRRTQLSVVAALIVPDAHMPVVLQCRWASASSAVSLHFTNSARHICFTATKKTKQNEARNGGRNAGRGPEPEPEPPAEAETEAKSEPEPKPKALAKPKVKRGQKHKQSNPKKLQRIEGAEGRRVGVEGLKV